MSWLHSLRSCREAHGQSLDSLARAFGMTATRLHHIEQAPDKVDITEREMKALGHYQSWVERWEKEGNAGGHWGGCRPNGWTPHFLLWRLRPGEKLIRDVVAQGQIWQDRTVSLKWLSPKGKTTGSVAHYPSWLDFAEVHLHDEPRTMVLYYNQHGITTQLHCAYSGRELKHRRWFKDGGHGPEVLTVSNMRTRVGDWGDNQANATLGNPPRWGGTESIRLTLFGDELMEYGGGADFDFFEVEAVGEEDIAIKRGPGSLGKDIDTVASLVDGAPEANEALRRIATMLGRGW